MKLLIIAVLCMACAIAQAAEVTLGGTPTWSWLGSGTERVASFDVAGGGAAPSALPPVTNALVLYYNFDGGVTNVFGLTNYNGTVTGAVYTNDAVRGQALYFITDDSVDCNANASTIFHHTNGTVIVWAKFDATLVTNATTSYQLPCLWDNADGGDIGVFRGVFAGADRVIFENYGSAQNTVTTAYDRTTWTMYGWVRSTNTLIGSTNGIIFGSKATTAANTGTKHLTLGYASTANSFLAGYLDEFLVYDRPLSQAELQQIYTWLAE